MSFEADLTALLEPIVANNVYWDVFPDAFKVIAPSLVIQQVGGKARWYVDQSQPQYKHCRLQILCWGPRKIDTNNAGRLIEKTIADSSMIAEPYGAFTALYQEDVRLYGTRQDFGFWYPDV